MSYLTSSSNSFRARVVVFDTLAAAIASTTPFGWGTIITIKGDNTRFKFAGGLINSSSNPATPTGKTFSQLSWHSTPAQYADAFAVNATATLTAAQLAQRYLTSTSAAAVSVTLPTAILLAALLGADRGSEFDFTVDNSAGANIVTVVVNTGIVAATSPFTGGSTLTVAAGTFGKFKIIFKNATTAILFRVV